MKRDVLPFKIKAVSIDRYVLEFETLQSGKLFDTILDAAIKKLPKKEREKVIREDIQNFEIPPEYLKTMRGKLKSFVKDVMRQTKKKGFIILNWDITRSTFTKFESEKKDGGNAWYIWVEIKGVYA